jgi:hypothetical protein
LAPATEENIGNDGAEDLHELTVNVPEQYTIESGGATDVEVRLLGPDSEPTLQVEEGDRGRTHQQELLQA